MKRKFIITLENSSIFNVDEFGDQKIDRYSTLVYHPMNSILRQEATMLIELSRVLLHDDYLASKVAISK